jgi:hypothetical protein
MIYNEIGHGGIKVRGCGINSISHIYEIAFEIGDILYNIYKAKRGILEKVVIKQIVTVKMQKIKGKLVVIYKDTFNALWNEWDLVDFATAKGLAEAYYDQLAEDYENLTNQC